MTREALLNNVAELVKSKLKPLVDDIDRKGLYPKEFMLELGKIGGFAATGTVEEGGNGLGLATQIAVLREIGKECGATFVQRMVSGSLRVVSASIPQPSG